MNQLICTLFNNPSMIQLGKNKNVVNELLLDLNIPTKGPEEPKGEITKIFLHNGKIIDGNKNMHPDNYKLIEKIFQSLRLKFILIHFNTNNINVSYKKNKGYVSKILTCFNSKDLQDMHNTKKLFKSYKIYFLFIVLIVLFFMILLYKYNV